MTDVELSRGKERMVRDTAIVAVMVTFLAALDQTAWAQARRAPSDPVGPAAPRGTASIAGHILTPGANTPVRGADVTASNERGMQLAAKTDNEGAYRFDRLAAGAWRITASKAGFVSWQFGQRRPFQLPPLITLSAGQQFTADIPLSRGGAISGRVYNASGDSAAGVQVRVYRARMEQGARRLKSVGVTDLTDDMGAFRVYGLPPGDYYVAASLRVAPVGSVVETTTRRPTFRGLAIWRRLSVSSWDSAPK